MGIAHRTWGGKALAEAVRRLYTEGQTDYSLEPIVLVDDQGQPVGRIQDGDSVIFCCRRGEREVQLTEAFTEVGFDHFSRPALPQLEFVILTLYHEKFKHLPVAFAPAALKDTLGELVSHAGLRQLRLSESEKFAHVTFFFNGGRNEPFPGEDDLRIPSPHGMPNEQNPALSLPQVAEQVLSGVAVGYDLIVTNFANGDVIGHTDSREAKLQCAALVDKHLGQVVEAALAADYVLMITADHGNLEEMVNPDGTPNVSHSTNPVPFLVLDPRGQVIPHNGKLADVAPTILSALMLPQPDAMQGISLAPDHDWGGRRRVLLIILDGWGMGRSDDSNPIFLAATPVWDELNQSCPGSCLQASGEAVGLKPGKAGNSEAGHFNLGAGRVVLQDDVRLDLAMQDGSFSTNEILCHAIEQAWRRHTSLHLIGLLSDKSSHGSIEYPLALLRMAKARDLERVFVHIIFDGRSTQPGSAPARLEAFEQQIRQIGIGQIVTGVGRSIALDRDGNYAKTGQAFAALVSGTGRKSYPLRGR